MAEQQLVDYIKKAREAGQSDDQSLALLSKNGWTKIEVDDALTALSQSQPQLQPQAQAQPLSQPTFGSESITPASVQTQDVQPQSTQSQPAQPQQNFKQPRVSQVKMGSNLVPKILMILAIVVVLGGGGYIVVGWNLFSPNPETVMNKMMENMKDVKSSHTTIQGKVSASDNGVSQGEISFDANGDTDITDVNNLKGSSTFSMQLKLAGSSVPFASAGISVIMMGQELYFKLNDLKIPDIYSPGVDTSSFKGKWFKIDQESIEKLSAISVEQSGLPVNFSINNLGDNSELTKKLQDIISSEKIYSVAKQLKSEKIDGKDTHHYLVVITKEKLKSLINKIILLEISEVTKLQEFGSVAGIIPLNVDEIKNAVQPFVDGFVDAVGDINLEMWIGKKDFMLYRTKLDKIIDLDKILQNTLGALAASSPVSSMKIEIKMDTTSSNFNQPITVQSPVDAQKIEDAVLPLLKIQKINSNIKKIGFIAQITKGNKDVGYSLLCSRGLLNGYLATYGSQLIALNNDIVSQGAKKPACFSGAQSYCVSTELADGSYLCVNKDGVGSVKCTSSTTACVPPLVY